MITVERTNRGGVLKVRLSTDVVDFALRDGEIQIYIEPDEAKDLILKMAGSLPTFQPFTPVK